MFEYEGKPCVRIGRVELYADEAMKMYEEGKYIVNYSGIWELLYSTANKCVYGRQISYVKGLARRGRYYAMVGSDVNRLLGYKLVSE